ncbi:preprotein translocase subunit TatA [Janibacter sp. G56]|uniref:preprotein translocase subunit TatA n=1 Tax=Janibacter sp. G56 TaxID=3418717 RepID=UPI003CFF51DF
MGGWEFIILVILAVIILGPDKLPDYAAKLARVVVQVRDMANNAKGQLKEQMGPEFEDVNWRQYDPRQYDPRRIVREALLEPAPGDASSATPTTALATVAEPASTTVPDGAVPYDLEAT